jgi:hypothetical protein
MAYRRHITFLRQPGCYSMNAGSFAFIGRSPPVFEKITHQQGAAQKLKDYFKLNRMLGHV